MAATSWWRSKTYPGAKFKRLGMAFYEQRYQQQQIKWIQEKAKDLGLVITVAAASAESVSEKRPTATDRVKCGVAALALILPGAN